MDLSRVRSIQTDYLNLIRSHCTPEYRAWKSEGLSLDQYLHHMTWARASALILPGKLSSVQYRKKLATAEVHAFWRRNEPDLRQAVGEDPKMAITIWGDSLNPILVRKLSIIFDTVVIADPIANFGVQDPRSPGAEALHKQFVLWALTILSLEPLINCDPPIVIVYPQRFGPAGDDEQMRLQIEQRTDSMAALSLSQALGVEPHESMDAVVEILLSTGISSLNKTLSPDRLLAVAHKHLRDGELTPSVPSMDNRNLAARIAGRAIETEDIRRLYLMFRGSFFLLGNRDANAWELGSDCFTSELLWGAVRQRDELVRARFGTSSVLSEEALAAISLEISFEWLDDISSEEVLEVRAIEQLETLRNLFKVDHLSLKKAESINFAEIANAYEQSVGRRLAEYRNGLVRGDWRISTERKRAWGSFAVATSLGVASLALPTLVPLAVGTAAYGAIVGGASVIDIIKQEQELRRTKKDSRQRVLNLLLEKAARQPMWASPAEPFRSLD